VVPGHWATNHATPDVSTLSSTTSYDGPDVLRIGNGSGMPIVNFCSTSLATTSRSLRLSNILHVPELSSSLLYVQRLARDNGVFFEFRPTYFLAKDLSTKETIVRGGTSGGLYTWPVTSRGPIAFMAARASPGVRHKLLGHPHLRVLRQILPSCSISSFKSSDISNVCSTCQLGKSSLFPVPRVGQSSSNGFAILSCLWMIIRVLLGCILCEQKHIYIPFLTSFGH